jgi:hypothetical protein
VATSHVTTVSFTVTHADVLYVAQQIARDLRAFRRAYPTLLSDQKVLDYHDAACTLLVNDAARTIAYTVYVPAQQNLVLHELRYEISYRSTPVARHGVGGVDVAPLVLPPGATFISWVRWSPRFENLSGMEQDQVLSGTGFGRPGSGSFLPRYVGGQTNNGVRYESGILSAQREEFRR